MSKQPQPVVSMKRDVKKKEWNPAIEDDWITESVAANIEWKAPFKCEVYAYLSAGGKNLLDLNGRLVCRNGTASACWFPMIGSGTWVFNNIDPTTGAVTMSGGAPYFSLALNSVLEKGFSLSRGEGLKAVDAWVVRYRRVG